MSGHYYAHQYNDAFKPTFLRNWRYGAAAYPGKLPKNPPNRRCKPLCFIAGDNGHLFSNIPRNACSSPWGDYRACIWEQKAPCSCIGKLRRPQFYFNQPPGADKPPCCADADKTECQ